MKKRLFQVGIAVLALSTFSTASLAAKCEPIPPKDVEGHIEFIPVVRQSLAGSYFEQNGCDWGANEGLNGLDAVVLDIEGMSGKATATAVIEQAFLTTLEGIFLDDSCARIGETAYFGSSQPQSASPYVIEVPAGSKWMIVQGNTQSPMGDMGANVSVKIHSDGEDCDVPKKKKKKKKKRRK